METAGANSRSDTGVNNPGWQMVMARTLINERQAGKEGDLNAQNE